MHCELRIAHFSQVRTLLNITLKLKSCKDRICICHIFVTDGYRAVNKLVLFEQINGKKFVI